MPNMLTAFYFLTAVAFAILALLFFYRMLTFLLELDKNCFFGFCGFAGFGPTALLGFILALTGGSKVTDLHIYLLYFVLALLLTLVGYAPIKIQELRVKWAQHPRRTQSNSGVLEDPDPPAPTLPGPQIS